MVIHAINKIFNSIHELGFAAMDGTESMLKEHKDVVSVYMIHHASENNMFENLAGNTCQRDWPVVSCKLMVPFLEDRCDVCSFPVVQNLPCAQGLLEDFLKDGGNFISVVFQRLWEPCRGLLPFWDLVSGVTV